MAEVYFYVPADEADNTVECGLKLSRWYDREVNIEGENRKCLCALLNPKDDIEKYRSPELRCLKLEVPSRHCFVSDGYLYRVGKSSPQVKQLFEKSIIPVEQYVFGSYRLPECLVTTTVIAGQIGILDKRLDSPILFNSSEDLYVNNIIEVHREEHDDFNDVLLYYFYSSLASCGKIGKIEDRENGIAIFVDTGADKIAAVKIPDLARY